MKTQADVRSETAAIYSAIPQTEKEKDIALERLWLEAIPDSVIVARALEILAARHAPGQALSSPADTAAYLQLTLSERQREFFAVLFLDNRNCVIALEELFSGTIDGASVYPRIALQRALALNASAVILSHNHPSGIAEPSQADVLITARIRDALSFVDIRMLDHIVVGALGTVSFAERGLI